MLAYVARSDIAVLLNLFLVLPSSLVLFVVFRSLELPRAEASVALLNLILAIVGMTSDVHEVFLVVFFIQGSLAAALLHASPTK